MPIYEYECSKCGHVFEKIQGFSASSNGRCPVCEGKASRLLSQCTFHLKGGGWYATDYAKDQQDTYAEKPHVLFKHSYASFFYGFRSYRIYRFPNTGFRRNKDTPLHNFASFFHFGIQQIPQPVAKQVEPDDCQGDGQPREDSGPGREFDNAPGLVEHQAPRGGRRPGPQAQKLQSGFGQRMRPGIRHFWGLSSR